MTTAYATSDDGLAWEWHGTVLAGRPGAWDARGARVTAVLADGTVYYDGRATKDENFRERTGIVGGDRAGRGRPLPRRPPAAGRRLAAVLRGAAPRRQPRAAHRAHRLGGVAEPRLITAVGDVPPSLARVEEPTRAPFRIGAVQEAWHPDAEEHVAALERGIAMAAGRARGSCASRS